MTRVATPENEAQPLEHALDGTAAHVEKLVRAYRWVERSDELKRENLRHESRHLSAYRAEDGMVVLSGRLEPEVGEVLLLLAHPFGYCVASRVEPTLVVHSTRAGKEGLSWIAQPW